MSKLTIELLHLHHGRKLKEYFLHINELHAPPLCKRNKQNCVGTVGCFFVNASVTYYELALPEKHPMLMFMSCYDPYFIAITLLYKSYPRVYYIWSKYPVSPWGSINFHMVLDHLMKPATYAEFGATVHFTVITWHVHRHSQRVCLQALADIFANFILSHLQEICYCTLKTSSTIVWFSFSQPEREKERPVGSVRDIGEPIIEELYVYWKKNIMEKDSYRQALKWEWKRDG